MATDGTHFSYPQANGSSLPSSQTGSPPHGISFSPNNLKGGTSFFMDISLDPATLASGELFQRLNTKDYPQVGMAPNYQIDTPIGVGPNDQPTYASCID